MPSTMAWFGFVEMEEDAVFGSEFTDSSTQQTVPNRRAATG
jgi:hypothetical protein